MRLINRNLFKKIVQPSTQVLKFFVECYKNSEIKLAMGAIEMILHLKKNIKLFIILP